MRNTLIIADAACKRHLTGFGHPESPLRFDAICTALQKAKLLPQKNWLKPRLAVEEDILLCHTEEYMKIVQNETAQVEQLAWLSTGDVVICKESYLAALLAVGGVLTAIDAVMEQSADNAFVVARPPGHHACTDRGMGFCIFNNIAIGARYAQKKGLQKILIIDWDVHHGNGTQEIFEADPSVFYFSTHQAGLYPGTGKPDERGIGSARDTKMNVPIQPNKQGREEILAACKGPLVIAMKTFRPDCVLISCGFDAHRDDPLGSLNLTDEDYGTLTQIAIEIADTYAGGRVVSVLEGGYNLQVLATASVTHVEALSGSFHSRLMN